jgi:hypothetical protein
MAYVETERRTERYVPFRPNVGSIPVSTKQISKKFIIVGKTTH